MAAFGMTGSASDGDSLWYVLQQAPVARIRRPNGVMRRIRAMLRAWLWGDGGSSCTLLRGPSLVVVRGAHPTAYHARSAGGNGGGTGVAKAIADAPDAAAMTWRIVEELALAWEHNPASRRFPLAVCLVYDAGVVAAAATATTVACTGCVMPRPTSGDDVLPSTVYRSTPISFTAAAEPTAGPVPAAAAVSSQPVAADVPTPQPVAAAASTPTTAAPVPAPAVAVPAAVPVADAPAAAIPASKADDAGDAAGVVDGGDDEDEDDSDYEPGEDDDVDDTAIWDVGSLPTATIAMVGAAVQNPS